jgi:lysophospholipid acyltransferase (LPLAT)-like uncharacterized protein
VTAFERFVAGFIGTVGAVVVAAVSATLRVRRVGRGLLGRARGTSPNGRVLFAFWHSRLLALVQTHSYMGAAVMVSMSRDGEMITRAIRPLGFSSVRGSATRGGVRAALELAARGRAGSDLALTVDGPKGPKERVKVGVAIVASRSGLPVVPVAAGLSRKWTAASWDSFQVPMPFARCVIVYGEPISVAPWTDEKDLTSSCREIEEGIRATCEKADSLAVG